MIKPPAPAAPWFQPKSKKQLFLIVGVLLAAVIGVWVWGISRIKQITAGMPPPVIQKARNLFEDKKHDEAIALLTDAIQQIEKARGPDDTYLVSTSTCSRPSTGRPTGSRRPSRSGGAPSTSAGRTSAPSIRNRSAPATSSGSA